MSSASISMSQQALIELLRGIGAHADPLACVEDISAEIAARRAAGFPHSVGQILFHINYWLEYELRRIRGERPKYPEHAAESFSVASSPRDEGEWAGMKKDFARLLAEFAALAKSPRAELDRQIESARAGDLERAGTLEAVLWQMVAHTSYHTGQIVVVRRALGAWPPRGGGDTW